MEQSSNVDQKETMRNEKETTPGKESVLKLSFIPPQIKEVGGTREKLAIASVVCGSISLVTWIVIIFGITVSIAGIVFSVFGIKSNRARYAHLGLGLSSLGLLGAILYAVAAARGMIPYNYFTT